MPTALLKVQATRRPISGEVLGLRLRAAENNTGSVLFGPSFNKPWFIAEGSDHTRATREHLAVFTRWLEGKGYHVELVGKLTEHVRVHGELHMANADKLESEADAALKTALHHADELNTFDKLTRGMSNDELQALADQLVARTKRSA